MKLSERTRADLAKAQRRREIEAAGREARTLERQEVTAGIDETVALGEARGGEFERPQAGRGERDKPVRRHTGVSWLISQGKLTTPQYVAAMIYGSDYRRVMSPPGLRSCLGDHTPGGDGPTLASIAASANATTAARERLARAMAKLSGQRDLIDAMNVICGDELTPREAGGNALGAAVYTTRLLIALDLLSVQPPAAKAA